MSAAAVAISLAVTFSAAAPASETLAETLRSIAAESRGKISMACALPGSSLNCDIEPTARPPMQSVFKLPLALTVLHQVEQGKYTLDQPIPFRREDLILPRPYSPLQDRYPDAGVEVPLRSLLDMTVSLSDNTAADILLRLAGGTQRVDDYIASLGVTGFRLRDGERALHRDETLQYRNWFEPRGAVQLLRRISDDSPLSADHTELLLSWMRTTARTQRLQADLPDGTVVAHKSGSSDVQRGVAAATNDIALMSLPDGRKLAVAVFLTDSKAGDEARDKVIARLGRAVYDAAVAERR